MDIPTTAITTGIITRGIPITGRTIILIIATLGRIITGSMCTTGSHMAELQSGIKKKEARKKGGRLSHFPSPTTGPSFS